LENNVLLFMDMGIRIAYGKVDGRQQEWLFSVTDVIKALTGSSNPRRYWSDLKRKLKAENCRMYGKILQFKLKAADGKYYLTDIANAKRLFCIIGAIPSPKAKPVKRWLKSVGRAKIEMLPKALAPLTEQRAENRMLNINAGVAELCEVSYKGETGVAELCEISREAETATVENPAAVRRDTSVCVSPYSLIIIPATKSMRFDLLKNAYIRNTAYFAFSMRRVRGSPFYLREAV